MRIKRFAANDMRSALRQIREEQGEHAVILSSRRTQAGVEVVAATDYDDALVDQFLRKEKSSAAPAAAGKPAEKNPAEKNTAARTTTERNTAERNAVRPPEKPAAPTRAPARAPATAARPATARPGTAPPPRAIAAPREEMRKPAFVPVRSVAGNREQDPGIATVRRELSAMRSLIEGQMSRFAEERLRGVPVRAMAFDELISCGCDRELARSIVAPIPFDADRKKARGLMLGMFAKSLAIPVREPINDGGIIALVGPSGAGKTTTIAKLAARYAASHCARDVALITTDTGRAGGREQLATFGRQLGMPVFEARDGASLAKTLDRLADYPLVMIDTAGLGPRDRALAAQFSWMATKRNVRSYLVLPANAQADDLDDVIKRFRCAAPEGAVLSKIDETIRLGTSLSVIARHRLPLAYVTDGQCVPQDLHRAEATRLVLKMGELRRAANETVNTETSHAIA